MTLACWCTTSQLHSPTHFHTWLTLSPSNWVASLQNTLKALFHGEFGVTDYSRAAGVTPRQNRHSVGGSLCMFKYFDVKHEGLVGQFSTVASRVNVLVPFLFFFFFWLWFDRRSPKVKQLFLWPLSAFCQLEFDCSCPLPPMSTSPCCGYPKFKLLLWFSIK